MSTNQAAWLDKPGAPFSVRSAPISPPGPKGVIIKVHAVAINPVDAARQAMGIHIATFPYILGCDAAGTIDQVGSEVTYLKIGDRVLAATDEYDVNDPSHASFQNFVTTNSNRVAKLPDNISFEDAAVVPLGLSTAAGMLFEHASLDLTWPAVKPTPQNKLLIVWGASSSVGVNAIQLAVAAGYRVIGVSSSRNFELIREAGAEEVFDHTDAAVVDKIVKYAETIGLQSVGVANAVSMTPGTNEPCAEIVKRVTGRKAVTTVHPRGVPIFPIPDLGEDIEVFGCLSIDQDDLLDFVWGENGWLTQMLGSGGVKCLPKPRIVGKGLESLNEACEIMRGGVSGTKLVVSIV